MVKTAKEFKELIKKRIEGDVSKQESPSIKVKFLKEKSGKKIGEVVNVDKKMSEHLVKKGDVELVVDKKNNIIEKSVVLKKELLKESNEQKLKEIKNNSIYWFDDDYHCSWKRVRSKMKKMCGHETEYDGKDIKWFFPAHSKDKISGRPQLIDNVRKKIPLLKLGIKKSKEDDNKNIKSIYSFDESFDKRYDGYQKQILSKDFWMYKVETEDGYRYYMLSEKQLPLSNCDFEGMVVEMPDFAEMSRSFKLPALSGFFFVKSFNPSVKILPPKEIIRFTKSRKMSEKSWLDFLSFHPMNTQSRFPTESEMLRSAQILSGKVDGYGLHLGIMSVQGTGKSMGYIETIAHKFSENPQIIEGGNSRIKGLSPSFKEKPANLGYLAKCERMGFVDEIGKMVEFEINKHQQNTSNVLGELNFLLENKKRLVGSGNDNSCEVKATAKFIFVSNPCSKKNTIYEHVGIIDPTTMSRIFWWVQDNNEQDFVLSDAGIIKSPPTPTQAYKTNCVIDKIKIDWSIVYVLGGFSNIDEFLTLFDSSNDFLSEIDDLKVNELSKMITNIAKEPMKSVWKSRGNHHVKLIIDGLCKHRCLFKDYDDTFVAKKEDYDITERILIRMVKSWDTDLGNKQELYRDFS